MGDLVKVKPGRSVRFLSKFRGPFKVKAVGGNWVKLENGQTWNLRRVALYCKLKDASGVLVESDGSSDASSPWLLMSDQEFLGTPLGDDSVAFRQSPDIIDVGVPGGGDVLVCVPRVTRETSERRPPAYLGDYVQ